MGCSHLLTCRNSSLLTELHRACPDFQKPTHVTITSLGSLGSPHLPQNISDWYIYKLKRNPPILTDPNGSGRSSDPAKAQDPEEPDKKTSQTQIPLFGGFWIDRGQNRASRPTALLNTIRDEAGKLLGHQHFSIWSSRQKAPICVELPSTIRTGQGETTLLAAREPVELPWLR